MILATVASTAMTLGWTEWNEVGFCIGWGR